jgi:hypothetical protein
MQSETISIISVSPRATLKGVEDTQLLKESRKYVQSSRPLSLLVFNLRSAILEDKPSNIMDYIVNIYFRTDNLQNLREIISH